MWKQDALYSTAGLVSGNFPVLGANIVETATGETHLPPYRVLERDGVKIVVLGMITPAIPAWLSENLWQGLRFDDMEETARKWMKVIREKGKSGSGDRVVSCRTRCFCDVRQV